MGSATHQRHPIISLNAFQFRINTEGVPICQSLSALVLQAYIVKPKSELLCAEFLGQLQERASGIMVWWGTSTACYVSLAARRSTAPGLNERPYLARCAAACASVSWDGKQYERGTKSNEVREGGEHRNQIRTH